MRQRTTSQENTNRCRAALTEEVFTPTSSDINAAASELGVGLMTDAATGEAHQTFS